MSKVNENGCLNMLLHYVNVHICEVWLYNSITYCLSIMRYVYVLWNMSTLTLFLKAPTSTHIYQKYILISSHIKVERPSKNKLKRRKSRKEKIDFDLGELVGGFSRIHFHLFDKIALKAAALSQWISSSNESFSE